MDIYLPKKIQWCLLIFFFAISLPSSISHGWPTHNNIRGKTALAVLEAFFCTLTRIISGHQQVFWTLRHWEVAMQPSLLIVLVLSSSYLFKDVLSILPLNCSWPSSHLQNTDSVLWSFLLQNHLNSQLKTVPYQWRQFQCMLKHHSKTLADHCWSLMDRILYSTLKPEFSSWELECKILWVGSRMICCVFKMLIEIHFIFVLVLDSTLLMNLVGD